MSEESTSTVSAEQQAMIELFQRHVDAELAGDLETTLATMTDHPHLNHVASMAGGVGRDGCARSIAITLSASSFRPT